MSSPIYRRTIFFRLSHFQFLIFLLEKRDMSKNTSISLGSHFDDFIQNRISAGRYKNASEVIRAGLRLLEEEESKIVALRQAIHEGIDSGVATEFDPERHLKSLKKQKRVK